MSIPANKWQTITQTYAVQSQNLNGSQIILSSFGEKIKMANENIKNELEVIE